MWMHGFNGLVYTRIRKAPPEAYLENGKPRSVRLKPLHATMLPGPAGQATDMELAATLGR